MRKDKLRLKYTWYETRIHVEGYTCVHAVEWDVINVKTSVLYVFPAI